MDINTWMDMEVTHSSYWVTKETLSTASSMWRYSVWARCSAVSWIKAMHNCNKCSAVQWVGFFAITSYKCKVIIILQGTVACSQILYFLLRDCHVCVWKCSLLHAHRFLNKDQLFQPKLWKVLARKCTAALVLKFTWTFHWWRARPKTFGKQNNPFCSFYVKWTFPCLSFLWHSLHRNGLVIRAFGCRVGGLRFNFQDQTNTLGLKIT